MKPLCPTLSGTAAFSLKFLLVNQKQYSDIGGALMFSPVTVAAVRHARGA
jgi:hypothetical protein